MPSTTPPKLLQQLSQAVRTRHMSRRTDKAYRHWARRYILFHGKRHPADMAEPEINAFLTHLAVECKVSASTQNQALAAILFLYRHVLGREVGELEGLVRARRRRKLPVVLSADEVRQVLGHAQGVERLVMTLLYGSGLRVMEGLRLRVKDLDFSYDQITVRDGKGQKDRFTMLPSKLKPLLQEHLRRVKTLHEADLKAGYGRTLLPFALARKYPRAAAEWGWQYVFPASGRFVHPETRDQHRHHLHERTVQRAFKTALRKAGIAKHATLHCLRNAST
jgi:integron integrase